MEKLIYILVILFSISAYGQGDNGGGPAIISDGTSTTDPYGTYLFGNEFIQTDNGGGPARVVTYGDIPGTTGVNPYEIIVGNMNDGGVPQIIFNNGTTPTVEPGKFDVRAHFGFNNRATDIVRAADAAAKPMRNITVSPAIRFMADGQMDQGQSPIVEAAIAAGLIKPTRVARKPIEFRYLGDVVDVQTADQGVMDRQTLLETYPTMVTERDGKIWVSADAPIVNYQTEEGEVVDFKFKVD